MTDVSVVQKLITDLDRYVNHLEQKRTLAREDYLRDDDAQAVVERRLEVAAQSCIDIGNHIIAQEGYELPDTYRDVFRTLGKHNVIPGDLASNMEAFAGLRNILTHKYFEIDQPALYTILQNDLEYLKSFVISITNFIS